MSSIFSKENLNLTGLENLFKMQITWAKKKMSHRAKCSTHLTEKEIAVMTKYLKNGSKLFLKPYFIFQ